MAFFKRKSSNNSSTLINVKDVYVATATIFPEYFDNIGCGPRCVTWFFLVRRKNNEYYELFSGKKIEKEKDIHKDGMESAYFDTPYIEKVDPLADYQNDRSQKKLDSHLLFSFITKLNVLNSLGAFRDDE